MSSPIHDDPLLQALAGLPRLEPGAQEAERVAAKCRARLQAPRRSPLAALEPAAVGTICALYAWHIARIALKIGQP